MLNELGIMLGTCCEHVGIFCS